MTDVREWLETRGFGQYADLFAREQVDLEALRHLTDSNLKDLGLPMGHRLKLLAAIQALGVTSISTQTDPSKAPDPSRGARTPGPRAERRQLTVMFCDLVGSTQLANQLDPEELRELMRTYQESCTKAVIAYEGHVAQYLGDGLMVYFGWPKAHENDAERAVRAGLAILETVKRVPTRQPLHVRIGIATGQVVIGETGGGDASVPKMAVGDTPNLAARVQGLAGPDEMLLAPTTRRLLGAAFDLEDLGVHALKGIADPVRIWRVGGTSSVQDRFAAHHGDGLAPLVGRDSELALLHERWRQAVDGEGQVLLLCGEAGVGKSRIAHTLRAQIGDAPHVWVQYQCSPFSVDTALYPIIEHFKRAAGFTGNDSPEQKLEKLEALLAQAGGAAPDAIPLFAELLSMPESGRYSRLDISPQRKKERTLEVIASQLLRAAEQQPLLLVCEDVHWIDPTTHELVDLLVSQIASARVLMLITHRPDFEPRWGAHAHLTRHSLNRLSRRQCLLLARGIAPKPLPEAVLAQIIDKTDGVPLFVEELTKTMLESDLLVDTGTEFVLRGSLENLRIPATLHDSLMARLDRLHSVKDVAQIGAVIGREFSYELLAAVSQISETDLSAVLEDFVRSELVYRRGSPPHTTYVFKHALVQDAAYDSLLKSKRIELHQRIAEALEKHFGDTAETAPEVLARHYTAAGLAERAVPYWLNAGRNAMARAANQEAIGHLERGLELQRSLTLSRGREERELDLLLELGEAQGRSGKDIDAVRTFEQAAEKGNALEFPERLANAALGCASATARMGVPSATSIRLLHQANKALPPGDNMLTAQVLAHLAVQLVIAGELEQSKGLRESAGAMAQRLNGFSEVAALLFLALVMGPWSPQVVEQIEIMLPGIREIIGTALLAGEKDRARDLFCVVTAASTRLRDVPAALAELQQFGLLAEEQRQPFNLYYVATFRSALALFAGNFEESEALASKALSIGRSVHGLNAEGMFGVQMFGVARERGQLKELVPLIDRFVSSTAQDSTWRPGLALIYAELGILERARKEFEDLVAKNFAAIPDDGTWLNCMCMLAEVCCMLDDVARSSELYAALLPYARCNVVAPPTIACYGALTRHLGMLAATLRHWDDAERHFEDALASNLQQGGLPWAAHTRYQYAAMLRARGRQEDAERSSNLLAEALKTARSLGMNALIERVSVVAGATGPEAAMQPR